MSLHSILPPNGTFTKVFYPQIVAFPKSHTQRLLWKQRHSEELVDYMLPKNGTPLYLVARVVAHRKLGRRPYGGSRSGRASREVADDEG